MSIIKAIVSDLEGTTTQLSFVKEVLFPYAYEHLPEYIAQHQDDPEVQAALNDTRQLLADPNLSIAPLTQQLLTWIEEDKKITPLKTLQGFIWQEGYQRGELTGHVYTDAIEQFKIWQQIGITLAIFSSGSILAQKLLLAHTSGGNLTPLFSCYFDTTIGAKNQVTSYQHIAEQLNLFPENILFLSDMQAELDAAAAAGMHTCGLMREDSTQVITGHEVVSSFFEIDLEKYA